MAGKRILILGGGFGGLTAANALEVGGGEAAAVQGNFFAVPSPEVELTRPSATAYGGKRAFEAVRLRQWF